PKEAWLWWRSWVCGSANRRRNLAAVGPSARRLPGWRRRWRSARTPNGTRRHGRREHVQPALFPLPRSRRIRAALALRGKGINSTIDALQSFVTLSGTPERERKASRRLGEEDQEKENESDQD